MDGRRSPLLSSPLLCFSLARLSGCSRPAFCQSLTHSLTHWWWDFARKHRRKSISNVLMGVGKLGDQAARKAINIMFAKIDSGSLYIQSTMGLFISYSRVTLSRWGCSFSQRYLIPCFAMVGASTLRGIIASYLGRGLPPKACLLTWTGNLGSWEKPMLHLQFPST